MPPKKKAKAYQMAIDVPEGTAVGNGDFVVGKQFAKGGFGKIYQGISKKSKNKVVIKIEPHENGPLFNEIAVFVRCLKASMLNSWKKETGVKFLGLPEYLGSGLFQYNGEQMRFLAMPMYSCSLENIRAKEPEMNVADVVQVTYSMLVALQYLHSQDIVHADLKADNILMTDAKRFDRTVLVDFGLAKRIPNPKEKADPKKAHNGTAIFTSIDAHRGCAPSFRGDIEILSYNVIYWITGSLPWQRYETELEKVADAKRKLLKGKMKSLKKEFGMTGEMSQFVVDLLQTVEDCEYEQRLTFKSLFKLLKVNISV
ncbi:hypothetical protein QR680_017804 [Steinernema hermaphroditum]|uniref:non-specific serine/threonine protein kinase n=1 Tax=Steinernema hermaphroditum TaxID=289476 RepID=A0AA39HGJ9_9BILA|nr:hypothetical protein QR680_017804 [Steinernema hermaphroditum]